MFIRSTSDIRPSASLTIVQILIVLIPPQRIVLDRHVPKLGEQISVKAELSEIQRSGAARDTFAARNQNSRICRVHRVTDSAILTSHRMVAAVRN
jgi:hypothetical protein